MVNLKGGKMPNFSNASLEKLKTCDPRIQKVFLEVVKIFDCKILCGHRGKEAQHQAFIEGKSKLDWPLGEHNHEPSFAVDVAPCINGKPSENEKLCRFFAGIVFAIAKIYGIKIGFRWGGDWDMDFDFSDQTFNDLFHFELRE